MINFKKALLASLVALSATSVMAYEPRGFYVGGGVGYSEADDICSDGMDTSCDDNDTAWTLLGGFQVNPNFAAEFGFSDLGNFSKEYGSLMEVDADVHAYDFSLLGILPLSEMFSMYGRAGYAIVDTDISVDSAMFDDGGAEGGWVMGAGASANVTDNMEVRLDWRRYLDADNSTSLEPVDVNVYSLQAVYHFGPKLTPAAAPAEQVSLNIQVLFDTDKSVIKPEYQSEIQKAVDFLTAHPEAKAVIEGHTDSTASDAYNQGLSERRANTVMDALIAKGIDAGRLTAAGYGEAKPVADNSTREGRAQNRRVVAEFSGVSITTK